MKKILSLFFSVVLLSTFIMWKNGSFENQNKVYAEGIGVNDSLSIIDAGCPAGNATFTYSIDILEDFSGNGGHRLKKDLSTMTLPVGATYANLSGSNSPSSVGNVLTPISADILNAGAGTINVSVSGEIIFASTGTVTTSAFVETGNSLFSDTATESVAIDCSSAQAPQVTLGAQATEHDNTQPNQDFTKTDTCVATGGTINGFTVVATTPADVTNIQAPVGIGSDNASITYDVRSADGEARTTDNIAVTCTTSNPAAGTDTENYTFDFTNSQPTFNTSSSVAHGHGGPQVGTITITANDVNPTDEVEISLVGGAGFSVNTSTPGNPGELTVDYTFADGVVGPQSFTFNVEDRHPVTGTVYSNQTNETFVFTLSDIPATAVPNQTGVQIGGKDIDTLTASDINDTDSFTVPVVVNDVDDNTSAIDFVPVVVPGLSFSGALVAGGGTVIANGASYDVTVTIDDKTLFQLPINLLIAGTDIHANPVPVEIRFGASSGGGGRRRDTSGTSITLGGTGFTEENEETPSEEETDTISLHSSADDKACFEVAYNENGTEIYRSEEQTNAPAGSSYEDLSSSLGSIKGYDYYDLSGDWGVLDAYKGHKYDMSLTFYDDPDYGDELAETFDFNVGYEHTLGIGIGLFVGDYGISAGETSQSDEQAIESDFEVNIGYVEVISMGVGLTSGIYGEYLDATHNGDNEKDSGFGTDSSNELSNSSRDNLDLGF